MARPKTREALGQDPTLMGVFPSGNLPVETTIQRGGDHPLRHESEPKAVKPNTRSVFLSSTYPPLWKIEYEAS